MVQYRFSGRVYREVLNLLPRSHGPIMEMFISETTQIPDQPEQITKSGEEKNFLSPRGINEVFHISGIPDWIQKGFVQTVLTEMNMSKMTHFGSESLTDQFKMLSVNLWKATPLSDKSTQTNMKQLKNKNPRGSGQCKTPGGFLYRVIPGCRMHHWGE